MNEISPSCIDIENNLIEYPDGDSPIPQISQDKREVNDGNMYRGNSLMESKTKAVIGGSKEGRYPSQLYADESMAEFLDNQSGDLKSGDALLKHQCHESKSLSLSGKNYERKNRKDYISNIGGCSKILRVTSMTEEELALHMSKTILIDDELILKENNMHINSGKAEEDLLNYPDYFFNTVFGDPPYSLGTEWGVNDKGEVSPRNKSQEFMGKEWYVDWKVFFKESFRVLKYGGYCILYCMDRQTLPLEYYASMTGFEICQHLYWYNIQGWSKSLNIGKALDKKGVNFKDLAEKFKGFIGGISPFKPCMEVILVFRKPIKNNTLADDVIEWNSSSEISDMLEEKNESIPTGYTCNYDNENLELVYYCPKVSKSERNAGCEHLEQRVQTKKCEGGASRCIICGKNFLNGRNPCTCDPLIYGKKSTRMENPVSGNNHATLKPLYLNYLISRLFKLPISDQKVYFPFSGVWSEIIGFLGAGYKEESIFACELDENNINIGKARYEYWKFNDYYFKNKEKRKIVKVKKSKDTDSLKLF